jgi:hypothetical protein
MKERCCSIGGKISMKLKVAYSSTLVDSLGLVVVEPMYSID